ncbi:caspase family protein [bacterium]|nr:caspase family protein [bacterium]
MKKTRGLMLFILLFLVSETVLAGDPSSKPMLKLATEMHSAMLRKISSDADGRFILTCGDDKTAKLWDADDGTLLKTFRVPAETGHEGKLFSCALSADGRTAAASGWTSKDGLDNNIYLFNTATGEISQRLPGLENPIQDLEFYSHDTLAATLGGGKGLRVFKKANEKYSLYKTDSDYGGDCYNFAFDNTGRLASASFDGFIRLYDNQFNLIKKIKATGGKLPFSVAFTADGGKLAVGYDDSGTVEVLDGRTLDLLYKPDNSKADSGRQRIEMLTFGTNGYLYGGGFYQQYYDGAWWHPVRRWSMEGKGTFIDFKTTGNSVMDIKSLPDGSILVAGAQPDFGRFSADGKEIFYKRGETLDFRDNNRFNDFTVNGDGSEISFKPMASNAFTFSIKRRELKQSTELFEKPRSKNESLEITDWENSYSPKINTKEAVFLDRYEQSRSVDIADDNTILVGANWAIYALDSSGNKKWRTPIPGVAWAVNITKNGKAVVVTNGGGEIRWYRMSDGAALLSLYVHPDGRRWILSTPEGYYAASPGADSLIGWHINNGNDQTPGFYPVSKFSANYYRPDVVENVIQFNDLDKALLYANKDSNRKAVTLDIEKMLPPIVAILSPQDGMEISTNSVVVKYRVKAPSGEEITAVKVFVDGRPLGERGIRLENKNSGETREITVDVPSKDSTISIVAENKFSASDPATIRLRWKGMEEEFIIKPKLYVLAIGVSKYEDKTLTLEYAAKDARDFADVLKRQKGSLYRDVVIQLLADENATKGDILDGLDWILKETTQKDVAMIFLAGHGVNDDYGSYYYLPQNTDLKKLRRTGVPYGDIKETVSNIAGKALFFIDTCHSGNVLGQRRGVSDTTGIINELSKAENGVVVFASSTGKQYSLENKTWGNGAFTKALVEAFSGKAAYRGNKITVNMLDLYVSERVKELTDGRQTPTTAKPSTIADFPVAVR